MRSRLPCRFEYLVPGSVRLLATRPIQCPHPEALFITCTDSALDSSLIRRLRSQPMLLLRTEGNTVPQHSAASCELLDAIDTAIHNWAVAQVVVCGHSGCAAMDTAVAVEQFENPSGGPPSTRSTRSFFGSMLGRMARAADATARAKQHALQQLENLRTYPSIRPRLEAGDVRLSALMFLHESGVFLEYDRRKDAFRPLADWLSSG